MKRILASIFSRGGGGETSVAESESAPVRTPDPRLVILLRDSSALGAFQLHSFAHEDEAAEFVTQWMPPSSEHGSLVFWIAAQQAMRLPGSNEERAAEAVVLIRDEDDPDIVYPFSMPDMEMAQAWLKEETRRGLDLSLSLVFWAARARITRDHWGRIHFPPVELPVYREAEPEGEPDNPEEATAEPVAELVGEEPDVAPESEAKVTRSFVPEPKAVTETLREIARGERWEQRDQPFEGFGSPPGRF
jgi:hypothetical protein